MNASRLNLKQTMNVLCLYRLEVSQIMTPNKTKYCCKSHSQNLQGQRASAPSRS